MPVQDAISAQTDYILIQCNMKPNFVKFISCLSIKEFKLIMSPWDIITNK